MTDTRKIQLGITADASEARAEIASIGAAGKGMADDVKRSADAAGKAIDGIGSGGQASAEKMDRATKSIISSIQRATAITEAGEKGTTKYFEALANQRGVSGEVLRPYLAQLEDARIKQELARQSMGAMGQSAAQMANNLRQVPMQMTDIVTGLATGQRPMSVLLQQGGQLKDTFGGIGPAVSALGGYVMSLVNPITVTLAAAAGLAYVFEAGREEAEKLQKTMITTGNVAGASLSGIGRVADEVSAATNATRGAVTEVVDSLIATGRVAADNFGVVSQAVVEYARATGTATGDLVKQFDELGKSPTKAIGDLNDKYHFLTAAVYDQIRALEQQGQVAEAAALAQTNYAQTLSERAAAVTENLGVLQQLWRGLADDAKGAWDAMLDIGRGQTLEQQLQDAVTALHKARAGVMFAEDTGVAEARVAKLREQIAEEQRLADIKAEGQRQERAAIALLDDADKYASKTEQRKREIARIETEYAKAVEKSTLTEAERLRLDQARAQALEGINAKYAEKAAGSSQPSELQRILDSTAMDARANAAGLSPETLKSLDMLNKAVDEGTIGWGKYVDAMSAVIDKDSVLAGEQRKLEAAARKTAERQGKEADALLKQEARAEHIVTSFIAANRAVTDRIKFQEDLVGLSGRELEIREALHEVELRYLAAKKEIENDATLTEDIKAAKIADLTGALERQRGEIARVTAAVYDNARAWETGVAVGMSRYLDEISNWAQQSYNLVQDLFGGMEDMVVQWARTGKLESKDLADAMIADLARVAIRQAEVAAAKAIADAYNSSDDPSKADYSMWAAIAKYFSNSSGKSSSGDGSFVDPTTGFSYAANGSGSGAAAGGSSLDAIGGYAGLGYIALIVAAFMAADYNSQFGNSKVEGDAFARSNAAGGTTSLGGQWLDGSSWFTTGSAGRLSYNGGLLEDTAANRKFLDDSGVKYSVTQAMDSVMADYLGQFSVGTADLIAKLGGSANGLQYGLGISTDPYGDAATQIMGSVADSSGKIVYQNNRNAGRGNEQQELQTEFARMTLAAIKASDADSVFRQMASSIDLAKASAEELSLVLGDIGKMQEIMSYGQKDAFADYANSLAAAGNSLTVELERQKESMLALAAGYDGTSDYTSQLLQATQERYQIELKLAEQVANALKDTSEMFNDSIRSVKLSVLDNQGKYNFYDQEAARYRDVLASLTDPTAIAEYSKKLNDSIMAAWGVLDSGQQTGSADRFVTLLNQAEDLAASRYEAVKENAASERNAIADAIADKVNAFFETTASKAAASISNAVGGTRIVIELPQFDVTETVALGNDN